METRARKFSSSIHNWYLQNGRKNLPWRKNITPYRVWISEIMLQQTQVKTVIPFYKKFMLRFPNLKAISEATEEEILALWTGLGFYRRAKNIYATKEIIKNKYKNKFPSNFDDLIIADNPKDLINGIFTNKRPSDSDWTNRLGL